MDWINNITDKNILQDNLSFVSLYIAVYEHMIEYVVSNLKSFLCDCGIKNGDEFCIETVEYKNKIKNRVVDDRGNKDVVKSSFLWFVDVGAITQIEYECFLEAKLLRNRYAHELTSVIYQGVTESEVDMFLHMFQLYHKISKWYFINVEAPIMGEELPDNIDWDNCQTSANVMFSVVLDVLYNGKSEEYNRMINDIKKGMS